MTAGQKRALVFLGMALCVVAALLWLPARQEGQEGAAQRLFPGIEATDLARIELRRGAATPLALERAEDAWQITAPQPVQADTWRAESLADTLATLRALAPMHGASPADFGLEADHALRVEVDLLDGAQHSLLVGDEAPVGGGTYILIAGEVRVAQGLLPASLPATLDALRTHQLWHVAPSEAGFVAIERSGLRLEALRVDESWRDGSGQPLDSDSVDAWLRGLANLRAEAFGPPPGLVEPLGWIEVRVGDGPAQVLTAGRVEGAPEVWWRGPAQVSPVTLDDDGLEPIEEGVRLLGNPSEAAPPS